MKIKELIFKIENLKNEQALEYIVNNAKQKSKKTFIVTINPEIVMLAKNDSLYENVLMSSDLALCDGVGVIWAGKMLGKRFDNRVHGADLLEKVSEAISNKPISIGLVGGGKNVAQVASDCLISKYPGVKINFAIEEWPGLEAENKVVLGSKFSTSEKNISHNKSGKENRLSCDILFVAFGSPKQEKWIYENLKKIDVNVAIGVGGAFDFVSGNVKRAPVWMRRLGLEWLYRLLTQPWRWKRQTSLIKFVLEVFKEKYY